MLAGLDPVSWAEFAVASILVELTPGPNMAWLAVTSAAEGRRKGFMAVLGVALGLAIVGLAAALGLTAIVSASPALWQSLRWGGVLWLLYLAWDAWRDAGGEHVPTDGRAWFMRGLVTNLLNPKAAVFYVAMLPGFTNPGAPLLPQTLTLTLTYVVIATAIHGGIVAAAGTASRLLTDPVRSRHIRRSLALLLAAVALWFAWSTRSGG